MSGTHLGESELRFEQLCGIGSCIAINFIRIGEKQTNNARSSRSVTRTGHMRSARRAPLPSARDETQDAPGMECRA